MFEHQCLILQVLFNMNLVNPMSKSVKCKKCGVDNLLWDMEYNTNTGNWRLWNPNTERPHECKIKPKKKVEPEKIKPCPYYPCDKKLTKFTLQEHIKKEHLGFF